MRILLCGGAGYIGAHTFVELVARGHDDWRLPAARELTALFAAYHQVGEEMKLLTEQGWLVSNQIIITLNEAQERSTPLAKKR